MTLHMFAVQWYFRSKAATGAATVGQGDQNGGRMYFSAYVAAKASNVLWLQAMDAREWSVSQSSCGPQSTLSQYIHDHPMKTIAAVAYTSFSDWVVHAQIS